MDWHVPQKRQFFIWIFRGWGRMFLGITVGDAAIFICSALIELIGRGRRINKLGIIINGSLRYKSYQGSDLIFLIKFHSFLAPASKLSLRTHRFLTPISQSYGQTSDRFSSRRYNTGFHQCEYWLFSTGSMKKQTWILWRFFSWNSNKGEKRSRDDLLILMIMDIYCQKRVKRTINL